MKWAFQKGYYVNTTYTSQALLQKKRLSKYSTSTFPSTYLCKSSLPAKLPPYTHRVFLLRQFTKQNKSNAVLSYGPTAVTCRSTGTSVGMSNQKSSSSPIPIQVLTLPASVSLSASLLVLFISVPFSWFEAATEEQKPSFHLETPPFHFQWHSLIQKW